MQEDPDGQADAGTSRHEDRRDDRTPGREGGRARPSPLGGRRRLSLQWRALCAGRHRTPRGPRPRRREGGGTPRRHPSRPRRAEDPGGPDRGRYDRLEGRGPRRDPPGAAPRLGEADLRDLPGAPFGGQAGRRDPDRRRADPAEGRKPGEQLAEGQGPRGRDGEEGGRRQSPELRPLGPRRHGEGPSRPARGARGRDPVRRPLVREDRGAREDAAAPHRRSAPGAPSVDRLEDRTDRSGARPPRDRRRVRRPDGGARGPRRRDRPRGRPRALSGRS